MMPPFLVVQSGGSTKSSDTLLDGPTPRVRCFLASLSLPGAFVSSHLSLSASRTITVTTGGVRRHS